MLISQVGVILIAISIGSSMNKFWNTLLGTIMTGINWQFYRNFWKKIKIPQFSPVKAFQNKCNKRKGNKFPGIPP